MNEQMDEVFWGAESLSLCSRNHSTICPVQETPPILEKMWAVSCSLVLRPASFLRLFPYKDGGWSSAIDLHTESVYFKIMTHLLYENVVSAINEII